MNKKTGAHKQMTTEQTQTQTKTQHSGVRSDILFGIVLPDGRKCGAMTRRQALDTLGWMPYGSRIDPPIPPGNEMALMLLDHLCDQVRWSRAVLNRYTR